MNRFALIVVYLTVGMSVSYATGIESLKDEYVTEELFSSSMTYVYRYTKTDAIKDGFSFICNMGQAIPDEKREGWYTNKSIAGLQLELRARAIVKKTFLGEDSFYNSGFVVLVKDGVLLKSFEPREDWFLPWWTYTSTDIRVTNSTYDTDSDWFNFDLLDGNGFYYKEFSDEPNYFLSNCHKIIKPNLPVYEKKTEELP